MPRLLEPEMDAMAHLLAAGSDVLSAAAALGLAREPHWLGIYARHSGLAERAIEIATGGHTHKLGSRLRFRPALSRAFPGPGTEGR